MLRIGRYPAKVTLVQAIRGLAMKTQRQRRSNAEIAPGFYEHYKGGLYNVLCVARHSETGEDFVVYESLADHRVWIRPTAMFREEVLQGGSWYPRFTKLRHPSLISFAALACAAA